jgi:hypothetical protein
MSTSASVSASSKNQPPKKATLPPYDTDDEEEEVVLIITTINQVTTLNKGIKIPPLNKFKGDSEELGQFIMKTKIYLSFYSDKFNNETQ